jgi:hypothetical protein
MERFVMITEILLGLILLAVVLFGLRLSMLHARQAKELETARGILESWFIFTAKLERQKLESQTLVTEPLGWVKAQLREATGDDLDLMGVTRVLSEPLAVDIQVAGGRRVVVSPLPSNQIYRLAQRLNGPAPNRLSQFKEIPLLGRHPKRAQCVERSLVHAPYFDLEAAQAGEGLFRQDPAKGTIRSWGTVDRLYFYIISPN